MSVDTLLAYVHILFLRFIYTEAEIILARVIISYGLLYTCKYQNNNWKIRFCERINFSETFYFIFIRTLIYTLLCRFMERCYLLFYVSLSLR